MQKEEHIITQTQNYVKKTLEGECSGHDWWHIYRVWNTAKKIGKIENADLYIVELGSLLHDIADWKFYNGDDSAGPKVACNWLENLSVETRSMYELIKGGKRKERPRLEGNNDIGRTPRKRVKTESCVTEEFDECEPCFEESIDYTDMLSILASLPLNSFFDEDLSCEDEDFVRSLFQ